MDLCKSVSNNFDECSNQDSICDGGSMERTEAGGRLKSIRGIWQNQPPMGFSRKIIFLEGENEDFYTHNLFAPIILFGSINQYISRDSTVHL